MEGIAGIAAIAVKMWDRPVNVLKNIQSQLFSYELIPLKLCK